MDTLDGHVNAWYALYTNPKQEDRAEKNLKAWGLETVNAKLRERRFGLYGPEPTIVLKPLFPRYIFAKFKYDELAHKVRFTRGVHKIVMFGDTATRVDEEIVAAIKSRMNKDGTITIGSGFKFGDTVVIRGGPFRNLMGVLERELPDSQRVQILLDSIGYQAHIEVPCGFVERMHSFRGEI